jgi:Holliday junction resolvasome RuvABC endonuclease subunit
MPKVRYPDLILAIALTSRGFAFVLFEGPLAPFDWGVVEIKGRDKNASIFHRIQTTIERYHPTTLITETVAAQRTARIHASSLGLRHMAVASGMNIHQYDRATIRKCFAPAGASTKYEIAQAIAREIPAFSHRLPPLRKMWATEDVRQSLFDAAALGLTHYRKRSVQARRPRPIGFQADRT